MPEVYSEICILQTIFDELLDFINVIPSSNETGFLAKGNDGKLHFLQDNIQYNLIYEKSKRIIEFIKTNKNIIIVGKPLILVNKPSSELLKLSQSVKYENEVIILEYAYISNTPIMLENASFREIYDSLEKSPKSIGIIDFLLYLIEQNKISFNRYCTILSLMSKQNYVCLPFSHKILIQLIQENGYIIDERITHVFDDICSGIYNMEKITMEIILTIFIIWNITITNEIKRKWSYYLFDKIINLNDMKPIDLVSICNPIASYIYNMRSQKDFIKFANEYLENYAFKPKK